MNQPSMWISTCETFIHINATLTFIMGLLLGFIIGGSLMAWAHSEKKPDEQKVASL